MQNANVKEIRVLEIKPYDFVSDKGQKLSGCNLFYVTKDQHENDKSLGYNIIKFRMELDQQGLFKPGAGVYKVEFGSTLNDNGKPMPYIVDAQFIKPIKLFDSKSA